MEGRAKTALCCSFLLTSLCGVWFVYSYWVFTSSTAALERAGVFVIAIAAVYFLGFQLYANQTFDVPENEDAAPVDERAQLQLRPFLPAILFQQIPILFLSALRLDGGMSFHRGCQGALGHWLCIAIIMIGRRNCATRIDELIVKWGFVPLMMLIGGLDDAIH
jgi:hypothetical protein